MEEKSRPTMQSVILSLQQYWADQGCVIWQPYHTEVGAGTMNPATFLRVLGPEPWWVAYVEPSIRPADGRYGENPNRWQHFYQFQVILKPDPGDPIERYLGSLLALGVDPAKHDIRFVEDNWVAPTISAWGLGWEVWLDGQEITQYTYFQQAGGHALDPVSVEITYGIERIVLALQGVDNFVDIQWNEHISYGDVYFQAEQEHSRYNFEQADVERLRVIYDEFEAEAVACLDSGLIFPAYDYALKCSHAFNLLDARGAIGVTERATMFGRMRDIAKQVAEQYLEKREELGYPWRGFWQESAPAPSVKADGLPSPTVAADFLLEIGTEELPASDLDTALNQLRRSVAPLLEENRLKFEGVHVNGTPRRIVIHAERLAPDQIEEIVLVKGPPAARAYDADGNPTKATEGFARSKGVPVEQLEVRELDGGSYVVAEIRRPGLPTGEVLSDILPELIANLRFGKSMRWNQSGVTFARPIRWLLALHGEHVVPLEFANIRAERKTRTLRFIDPEYHSVSSPQAYFEILDASGIILDVEKRREIIRKQISQLAAEVDGEVPEDPDLMNEVANLVEKPTALRGGFDESYLELPGQVLICVLKEHQRCFPVRQDGRLLPYFIAVRNGGDEHLDVVRVGNEQVVGARFADAAYFYQRDLEQSLQDHLPQLASMTFQADLGSMADKVGRIEKMSTWLAGELNLNSSEKKVVLRAARLSKADLATRIVVEMTSLQGAMGREYAIHSGEKAEVAQAIYEHYLPRFAGDEIPETKPGLVIGLADRLDTLLGLFAVGHHPTGAGDPFALRRSAIGIVQMLVLLGIHFDLQEGLERAAVGLPIEVSENAKQACLDFIVTRQQVYLLGQGHRHDAIEAVLAEQGHDPAGAAQAVESLEGWRTREDWDEILQAYARCARITRDSPEIFTVNPKTFVEDDERALYAAIQEAEAISRIPGSVDDFFKGFLPIIPTITTFFDEVLVMAEKEELRKNRLGILQRIVALADGVADLSKLEGF